MPTKKTKKTKHIVENASTAIGTDADELAKIKRRTENLLDEFHKQVQIIKRLKSTDGDPLEWLTYVLENCADGMKKFVLEEPKLFEALSSKDNPEQVRILANEAFHRSSFWALWQRLGGLARV